MDALACRHVQLPTKVPSPLLPAGAWREAQMSALAWQQSASQGSHLHVSARLGCLALAAVPLPAGRTPGLLAALCHLAGE